MYAKLASPVSQVETGQCFNGLSQMMISQSVSLCYVSVFRFLAFSVSLISMYMAFSFLQNPWRVQKIKIMQIEVQHAKCNKRQTGELGMGGLGGVSTVS